MANRNDIYPDIRGLGPTIPPDPERYADEDPGTEGHGSVTVGGEPTPRALRHNWGEWTWIAVAGLLAILGILVVAVWI